MRIQSFGRIQYEFESFREGKIKVFSVIDYICNSLVTPGKYTSDEEKARILAWRQENVPLKVTCERSERGKATIIRILAAAKKLPRNTVSKHKYGGGRRGKTSRFTDTIVKRELQKNTRLMALDLQTLHPNLLKNPTIRTVQHRLQKDWDLPSRKAVKKTFLLSE